MPIKFLVDHTVPGIEPETFKANQVVKDKKPESELHFVRRGLAAYVDGKGRLTDHEGREVSTPAVTTQVVDVAANRGGDTGRAGETTSADGTPQRASSGPGAAMTAASTAPATTPAAPAQA